ncbi:MAG: methylated-DNA--[protein]-cysteine S-methyltransferase [Hyphomicrobiales bacterium]
MPVANLDTPVGRIAIVADDAHITRVTWSPRDEDGMTPLLAEAQDQLKAYFENTLDSFDLPLAPRGTAFQQQVYEAMKRIPLGETTTYGTIAKELGVPAQPVGQACGSNPIPIIIPCHRVLAAEGLGGFSGAGGVETKVQLLRHEGAYSLLI